MYNFLKCSSDGKGCVLTGNYNAKRFSRYAHLSYGKWLYCIMLEIRLANPEESLQMLEIYGPIIQNTAISFELQVPTVEDFQQRVSQVLHKYPWLVCKDDTKIAGYAYAGPHRTRYAYQWSVELSVYIRDGYHRQGIARALYHGLMDVLRLQGYHNALCGITLPNPTSVSFHESMGFSPVGIYRNVGFKMDAWHSVGWWELALQPPNGPPPTIPLLLHQVSGEGQLTAILGNVHQYLRRQ